jgi:hypothetical protein
VGAASTVSSNGNGNGPERSRQLGEVWSLPGPVAGDSGVADVEKLCRSVLIESLRKQHMSLPDQDFRESLCFLLGEVVVLRERYVPAPGRELGPYLYSFLRLRLIDYWRSWYGRDGRHRLAAFDTNGHADSDPDSWRVDGLDPQEELDRAGLARSREAYADGPEDRVSDVRWAIATGDRRLLREAGGVGLRARIRAEARDDEPARAVIERLLEEVAA